MYQDRNRYISHVIIRIQSTPIFASSNVGPCFVLCTIGTAFCPRLHLCSTYYYVQKPKYKIIPENLYYPFIRTNREKPPQTPKTPTPQLLQTL